MRCFVLAVCAALLFFGPAAKADEAPYDLVIRNGKIVDGTGNPWILLMASMETGRSLAPCKTGSRASPVPAWKFQEGCTFQPRCGLRTARLQGDHDHALLQPAAPILLRHRPARKKHVRPRPRPAGPDPLRGGPARRPRRSPRRRRPLSAG